MIRNGFYVRSQHSNLMVSTLTVMIQDNMRYALSTCLFNFRNNSDSVSTPCSTSTACGPLKVAIGNADLVPKDEDTYSFCSADSHALLGESESKCTQCLRDSPEVYLSNCMSALAPSQTNRLIMKYSCRSIEGQLQSAASTRNYDRILRVGVQQ